MSELKRLILSSDLVQVGGGEEGVKGRGLTAPGSSNFNPQVAVAHSFVCDL